MLLYEKNVIIRMLLYEKNKQYLFSSIYSLLKILPLSI